MRNTKNVGLFSLFQIMSIVSIVYASIRLMNKKKQQHLKKVITFCQILILTIFILFLIPSIFLLLKNKEDFFRRSFDILSGPKSLQTDYKLIAVLFGFYIIMMFLLFPLVVITILDIKQKITNPNKTKFVFIFLIIWVCLPYILSWMFRYGYSIRRN